MRTAVRVGAQQPTWFVAPAADSYESGDDAVEFAASLGLVLDDWQAWCVRQMLAERADGSLAATNAGLLVPRQSGKNSIVEAIELYGLYVVGLACQVHSAHLTDTAAKHMARLKMLIGANPELTAVTTVYAGAGQERIFNRETGGVIEFSTRTKHSKRGASPQRIVFDEALYLQDEHLQAMVPALSAQSMDPETAPQMVFLSSAPLAESRVLHRLRDAAMSDCPPGRMFMAAWEASGGVDVHDRDVWYATNPGLGIRISEEWIADTELPTLSPEAFAIERLGVPERPASSVDDRAVDPAAWAACADGKSRPGEVREWGVDVSPDRRRASIGLASLSLSGPMHVELVETREGTAWVVARCAELVARWGGRVAVEPGGPAGSLLPDLVAAGVPLVEVSSRQVVQACGRFVDLVAAKGLRHLDDLPSNDSVGAAMARPSGDAWRFDRRTKGADLTPLYAMTFAAWAAAEAPTAATEIDPVLQIH